jgi:2-polyprenyl-3-methyl-5-hydroxy-6-metoxy-1,4-benzoquinol methylase
MKYAIYRQIKDVPKTALVSGVIKGGDWDRETSLVQDLDIVRGAKDHFISGIEWEKTDYYANGLEEILRGNHQWYRCRNKRDLDEHCSRFDRLFESIRNNGYKPQSDIHDPEYGAAAPENEIVVHIDRDGRFLFCNGAHRLAIVLALGIERIPVKVCIRHAQWQSFCTEILNFAKRNGGKVYQPLTHPDLRSIPSVHGDKRFDIIKDYLPQSRGDLLDIGANWGYFCHRCEELGFDCYAVEANLENAYFLKKLKTAQDRNFRVIEQSILTYREKCRFDVVLALNIFHHFLKQKADHEALINFLQRMDINLMFFEPHRTSEAQMNGAYRNYEPDEFVQFLLRHSSLTHADLIGKAEDERPIYKLRK